VERAKERRMRREEGERRWEGGKWGMSNLLIVNI